MNFWKTKLVSAIEIETVERELLEHLDEILLWIARGDDGTYLLLQKKIGEKGLNQRIEEFLDRLIVGDCPLGPMFPLKLSQEHAKRRYRQLIRIFHPDRGVKPQEWLNYRAERINKSYQNYIDSQSNEIDLEIKNNEGLYKNKVINKSKYKNNKSKISFTYKSNIWRERLGNPQQFQRKVISVLIACSLLLVLLVFLSSEKQGVELNLKKAVLNNVELDELPESSGDYVVDLKARKILKEADEFFVNQDVLFEENDTSAVAEFELNKAADFDDFTELKEEIQENKQRQIIKNLTIKRQNAAANFEKKSTKTKFLSSSEFNKNKQESNNSYRDTLQKKPTVVSKNIFNSDEEVYKSDSIEGVPRVDFTYYVEQLKRYYELGDSDGTANLYISSGRENDIRGSDKLRKYYRKAFAKTSNRKFEYVISSIRQDKESAVVIEGLVDLSYSSKTLLRKVDREINATFVVLLLKVGKEFKIASFDWEEV